MDDIEHFSKYIKEKKQQGKKIVAFMAHDNVPEELIDAAGFFPLRLIFAGNEDLLNQSQSLNYIPASTCSFAQCTIGLFSLKPDAFDFLNSIDYFIVSNHCVSDICASEIISKCFYIPRLNFYSSYTQTDQAMIYFKAELLDLKAQFEKIRAAPIKNEQLLESVKKYNILKLKLQQVNELNIPATKKLDIFQKAMLYGLEYVSELEKFIEESKNIPLRSANGTKDLLLTGCSVFVGDFLLELIEKSGGNVAYFDTWVGNSYFSQIISERELTSTQDPLDLLVSRFKRNIYGDHCVTNYFENKLLQIESIVKNYQQQYGKKLNVINHIIKYCDHVSLYQTFLKNKLQEKGIQVLNLERDYSRASHGQLSTRIEAFLEMM